MSATKLRSQGCALQLVLLPFGEDKESMDEYALYKGETSVGRSVGGKCGSEVWEERTLQGRCLFRRVLGAGSYAGARCK